MEAFSAPQTPPNNGGGENNDLNSSHPIGMHATSGSFRNNDASSSYMYGYDASRTGVNRSAVHPQPTTVLTPTASVTTVVTTTKTVITTYPPLLFRAPPSSSSQQRRDRRRYPLADAPTPPALKRFAAELLSSDGQSRPGYDRSEEEGKVVTIQFQEEQVLGSDDGLPMSVLNGTNVEVQQQQEQSSPMPTRKRPAPYTHSHPCGELHTTSNLHGATSRLAQHAQYSDSNASLVSGTSSQHIDLTAVTGEHDIEVMHGHAASNRFSGFSAGDESNAGVPSHLQHQSKRRHLDQSAGYTSSTTGTSTSTVAAPVATAATASSDTLANAVETSTTTNTTLPLSVSLSAVSTGGTSDNGVASGTGVFGEVDPNTLPSPTMSPVTQLDPTGQSNAGMHNSYFNTPSTRPLTPHAGHSPSMNNFSNGTPATVASSSPPPSARSNALVRSTGHQPNLLDLPEITRIYETMPESLQTYLLFQLLRRTPLPTLQFVCSYTHQHIRRDFLAELPKELALHVASFLNVRSLCRAAQVSKRWREIVDGEASLWKRRLILDGLCDNEAELDGDRRDAAPWEQPSYWYMGGGNSQQIMAELIAREERAKEEANAAMQAGSAESASSAAWDAGSSNMTQNNTAMHTIHQTRPAINHSILAPVTTQIFDPEHLAAVTNNAEAPVLAEGPALQANTSEAAVSMTLTQNAAQMLQRSPSALTELRERYAKALAAAAGRTGLPPLPNAGDEDDELFLDDEYDDDEDEDEDDSSDISDLDSDKDEVNAEESEHHAGGDVSARNKYATRHASTLPSDLGASQEARLDGRCASSSRVLRSHTRASANDEDGDFTMQDHMDDQDMMAVDDADTESHSSHAAKMPQNDANDKQAASRRGHRRTTRKSNPLPPAANHPYKRQYRQLYLLRRSWYSGKARHLTFAAHTQHVVTCLHFDGRRIISGSDDYCVCVWDAATGALLRRMVGHEGGVWALAVCGDTVVSGSTDRAVRVWDVADGRCTHILWGHTSTVRCCKIIMPRRMPTGELCPSRPVLVTGSRDTTLRVWWLPSPRRDQPWLRPAPGHGEPGAQPAHDPFLLYNWRGHTGSVRAVDGWGRWVVSGSYDFTVRIWDLRTGACRWRLLGHTQKVYSVSVMPGGELCASGSMDGTVRVWRTADGSCAWLLEGHTSLVGLLDLVPQRLVSAAADATLRIWSMETGACRKVLSGHMGAITCFQQNNHSIVSGSDSALKLWDLRQGRFVRDLLTNLSGVWQVRFDRRRCVAAVQRENTTWLEVLDFGCSPDDQKKRRRSRHRHAPVAENVLVNQEGNSTQASSTHYHTNSSNSNNHAQSHQPVTQPLPVIQPTQQQQQGAATNMAPAAPPLFYPTGPQ